ncbi:MAG: hypothetical protein FJY95_12715 [Candidatus Handelsmanbacteria bacterium]|nr:hypothetical protein [Candidatus Handelsmanbacteria bacterium]
MNTIHLDKTPPTISPATAGSRTPGSWYLGPIAVSFSGAAAHFRLAGVTLPITQTNDGANQSVTGTATDLADNTAHATLTVEVQVTPSSCGLVTNCANPLNPSTTIAGQLPQALPVRPTVCNLMGQPVRVLAEEMQEAGPHALACNGRDQQGQSLAAGVNRCRLQAGERVAVQKLHFAKYPLRLLRGAS